MIGSASFVALSLASMGASFYMAYLWGDEAASARLGWLPLLSLIVFFIAYSGGMANVPFIIMGELFPARYRSVLGPISSSFNLLCNFTVVRCFPAMQISMGPYGTFWFFMCCTILSIVFVFFFLPETKGRTLEDIELLFSRKYSVSDSSSPIAAVAESSFTTTQQMEREVKRERRRESRVVFNISSSKDSTEDSDDDEEDGSLVHFPS